MNQEINLTDANIEFEEKVYVMADEVLSILKELSLENKKQISGKAIAEKMIWRDSVKNLLFVNRGTASKEEIEPDCLKELSNTLLGRLTDLMPSSITEKLSDLKEKLHNKEIAGGSREWLDSPIKIVRKYIDSLVLRNSDLENFIQQTMNYLAETEGNIISESTSQHQRLKDDRIFEDNISENMGYIKNNINNSNDFNSVKMALMSKIENINRGIEIKRDRDMQRLKETENTLEKMSKRMLEIKREADDIRKRSQELEVETFQDNLTGIYNRRAYDQRMIETLANFERYNVPASLMICDIDFFKKINDTYGHNVGDLALKKLASLLKERLRINDFVSRYGGEEFAVILPHTDLNGATLAGEGIRSYIDKSVFSYKNQKISLTISVGVSAFRKGDNGNTVFERADSALYLAKRSGRNQVKSENDTLNECANIECA
ncbi:MAG: GGDEF domain-containing protein [Nitrospirae bacterium]|nr:GGDEF domain-containing protein [Nitrospirota bacterium]